MAEKLSETPTRMVEADWQPLRELGFDDVALLEIGHIVGIFNYLTRLADGFGLQLDRRTGIPWKPQRQEWPCAGQRSRRQGHRRDR